MMDVIGKDIMGYQLKMLTYNSIPGVLPIEAVKRNGLWEVEYNYDGKKCLKDYIEKKNISDKLVLKVIDNIKEIPKVCKEYFLDEGRFNISEDTVYIDDSEAIYFMYNPLVNICYDYQKQLQQLNKWFMTHISVKDEEAVQALHRVMIMTKEDGFSSKSFDRLKENQSMDVSLYKKEGEKERVINETEEKRSPFPQIKLKALNKEAKLTFIVLELILMFTVIIVLKKVMFTSDDSLILFFKSIFFVGLFIITEGLIVKKVVFDEIGSEMNDEQEAKSDEVVTAKASIKESKTMHEKMESNSAIPKACLVNDRNVKIELIKTPFIIGSLKKRVDLFIANKAVSKHHARIIFDEDQYYIEDLNSKNGTFINHNKVEAATLLRDNSRITFANENYIFRLL